MQRDLICKWLELPPERWPPDHYAVLGLPIGEADVGKIEEHTHDRLARLRQYQLNHPDPVTEAMNRLAEAFSCLTDPAAKKAYDASLGLANVAAAAKKSDTTVKKIDPRASSATGIPKLPATAASSPTSAPAAPRPGEKKVDPRKSSPTVPIPKLPPAEPPAVPSPPAPVPAATAPPAAPPSRPPAEPGVGPSPDPLAWLFGAWSTAAGPPATAAAPNAPAADGGQPVAGDWKTEPPPARVTVAADAPSAAPSPEPEAPIAIPPPVDAMPPDLVKEAARNAPGARRGLGTKRQMYHRLATTRQLINAWMRSGRYLAEPERRLTRLADANDLVQEFSGIQDLLKQFPPLIGEAGQPGYLVLALAKQPSVVPTFRGLAESQRIALARDWNAALEVLLQHRDFLREEARSLRKKSRLARLVRAASAFCSDHSLSFLICAGVLALLIGMWTYYRYHAY